jgi:hypothetical protein
MMEKHSINQDPANDGNMLLSAVVIERQEDGDVQIVNWSKEFEPVMNGIHPDDNFDNTDVIPKKKGRYTFDVSLNGGKDFNGEHTEYWSEFLLYNCR